MVEAPGLVRVGDEELVVVDRDVPVRMEAVGAEHRRRLVGVDRREADMIVGEEDASVEHALVGRRRCNLRLTRGELVDRASSGNDDVGEVSEERAADRIETTRRVHGVRGLRVDREAIWGVAETVACGGDDGATATTIGPTQRPSEVAVMTTSNAARTGVFFSHATNDSKITNAFVEKILIPSVLSGMQMLQANRKDVMDKFRDELALALGIQSKQKSATWARYRDEFFQAHM